MIRVLWPLGARGMWDQGDMIRAFEGSLWPGFRCEEHLESRPEAPGTQPPLPVDQGAIVIASGAVLTGRGHESTLALVKALPWCLFLHSSDESLAFDSTIFDGPRRKRWVQIPRPGSVDGARRWLIGGQCDLPDLQRPIERRPLSERPLRWAFGGQAFDCRRRACVDELVNRRNGDLYTSKGFAQGRPREEHLRVLASAAIAPCPPGPQTPDSFRLYEAIGLGCLPVCDRFATMWPRSHPEGYWMHALGREPFPCVNDWTELTPLMDRYAADPVGLQRDANKAGAWRLAYQRKLVTDMLDDVEELSGGAQPRHAVTVIIPTSPVAAHPSTAMIEECIRRVRAYPELREAEVIITADGVRTEQAHRAADYEEYKRRLIDLCAHHPDFRGCLPVVFDEWTHQAGMMRRALQLVRTPLVLYVEHDTWPVGAIDWSGIFRTFELPDVNAVKLSIFDRVLDEHRYLMLDSEPRDVGGVPLMRTMQWSQRPHVARADWYRRILPPLFGRDSRAFIEDVLWAVIYQRLNTRTDPFERWGLWLYAPPGDMTRSATCNGRGAESKYTMIVAYDGEQPEGAPRPGVLGG